MTSDKIIADLKVLSKYRPYPYLSISAFYARHFAFLQEIFSYFAPNANSTKLKKGPHEMLYLPDYDKNGASTIGKSFFRLIVDH